MTQTSRYGRFLRTRRRMVRLATHHRAHSRAPIHYVRARTQRTGTNKQRTARTHAHTRKEARPPTRDPPTRVRRRESKREMSTSNRNVVAASPRSKPTGKDGAETKTPCNGKPSLDYVRREKGCIKGKQTRKIKTQNSKKYESERRRPTREERRRLLFRSHSAARKRTRRERRTAKFLGPENYVKQGSAGPRTRCGSHGCSA